LDAPLEDGPATGPPPTTAVEPGQVVERYLAPLAPEKKKSLPAGLTTTGDCKRLQATTNRDASAKVEDMEVECPPTTFGDRLHRAMLTRKVNATQLASDSGLNKSHVHRLLRSADERPKRMKTDTIIALSRALDVDGWWLQTGEGEPPHGNDRSEDHEG